MFNNKVMLKILKKFSIGIFIPQQGWTEQSGNSGKSPKGRIHEVEKTLNSECGELQNVYINKLTLKLWVYQIFAAFFNIAVQRLHLIYRPLSHTVPGPKNLASPPPDLRMFIVVYVFEIRIILYKI